MDITRDVNLGKTVLSHMTGIRNLELNGHKLYKGSKKQSNVITVKNGATLNIYGGRLNWTCVGTMVTFGSAVVAGSRYFNDTGLATDGPGSDTTAVQNAADRLPVYLKSGGDFSIATMNNPNCTYKGGMIAGGWSSGDGGAIRLEGDNSRLKLFNVYLVGNIAEDNGGAISMNGSYQRVDLENTTIAFNRAISKNGGAIYMGDKDGNVAFDGALTAGSRTEKTSKTFKTKNDGTFAVYRGVAEFPAFEDGSKDRTSTFFYSDGYFFDDPKTYQPHLATLSIHLAAASFYSNDGNQGGVLYGNKTGEAGKNFLNVEGDETYYPAKSNNIRQFMSDIGIPESNIYLNDFNIQKPSSDSIGVAIGSKVLKQADGTDSDKTLVVVGVRGAGYEQEWISNLTLGNKGEASGFSSASKQVFKELNKYLDLKNIDGTSKNTIFWVAGYSRAGATSNLTGKRIVDAYDKKCTHTFVYTFEAPQGGSIESDAGANSTKKYECIHNVINDVDIVPKVGPSNMGFFRYGVDHYVPGGTASSGTSTTTYYNYPGSEGGKSYTTRSDNNVEKPGSAAYEANKSKMLTQLRAISGYNIMFNDYYHSATMEFVANKLFGNLGTQLIGENNSSHVPKNAGDFGTGFLQNLMAREFRYETDNTTAQQNKDKFYRYNYSTMSREGMTFENAIGSAAGVVFSLTPAQMEGLSGIGSSISQFFKGWRVNYSVLDPATGRLTSTSFHSGSSSEQLAKLNTFLQGFDLADRQANFVVNTMGTYEFVPVYTDGIRAVTVQLSEVIKVGELPTTSTVQMDTDTINLKQAATTWSNNGDGEYTVVVTLPRGNYDRNLRASVERADMNAFGQDVVVARRNNPVVTTNGTDIFVSQQVKLIGYTGVKPDPVKHKVTISVLDLNRNVELGTSQVLDGNQGYCAGEQVTIDLPEHDGYTYLRMLQQSDTNGFEVTNLNGLKVENNKLSFEMVDKDVELVAGYVPLVNKVTVMLDRNLEPGKTRPNVKWVDFGIGTTTNKQTWRIESGFRESWNPTDLAAPGTALEFNTTYGLNLTRTSNSTDEMKGYLLGDDSGLVGSSLNQESVTTRPTSSPNSGTGGLAAGQTLTAESTDGETVEMFGQFKLASDVEYKVYYLPEEDEADETDETGDDASSTSSGPREIELPANAVLASQSRWGTFINFTFNPTRTAQVIDVIDPDPVEVYNTDNPQVSDLVNPATAVYEDGSSMEVENKDITWKNDTWAIEVFDDGDSEGSKQRDGYVATIEDALPATVPGQGDAIPEELQKVYGTVVVYPLPQAEEPFGYLSSGDIYGSAEDFVDIIHVGADDTNSVKLELYAEEESYIYYHVDEGADNFWNWAEYDIDSDGIEIGWGNSDVANGTTKTVTVQARAAQSGCLASELVEYEFTLVKVPSTVTYAVTTNAVCGEGQLFTTVGGGEYTSGTKVTLSAPGSFAVGDTVYRFKKWSTDSQSVAFNTPAAATTTFTMPKNAVEATAEYEVASIVAEPVPSLMPGKYTVDADASGKQLSLIAATGAEIHYTMTQDGTEPADPTAESTTYTGPISLAVDAGQTRDFKVKALAVKKTDGGTSALSNVVAFSYSVTRLQPSYQVSVESGSIVNVADAVSTPEGADSDTGAFTKAVFAKESSVTVVADDVADKVFKGCRPRA